MVRSISVRLLVEVDLMDFAEGHFAELMTHPDHREDALQELRMIDAFLPKTARTERRRMVRRALSWLAYNLGVTTRAPRFAKPLYTAHPKLERGTFLNDLSEKLEVARAYDVAA